MSEKRYCSKGRHMVDATNFHKNVYECKDCRKKRSAKYLKQKRSGREKELKEKQQRLLKLAEKIELFKKEVGWKR